MRRSLLALPVVALAASTTFAFAANDADHKTLDRLNDAKVPGVTADPSAVPAGTYDMDETHVNVTWAVSHLGFSLYQGRFNDIDGSLTIDPAAPQDGSLSVTIKANSIDTLSEALDEELRGEMLNATDFPDITFESTKIEVNSEDARHAKVTGDLTIKDVTKPVTMDVHFVGGGLHPRMEEPTIGFQATAELERSEFGLTNWSPFVGDIVTLNIGVEFNKDSE